MDQKILVDPYDYIYLCSLSSDYSLPDLTPEHIDHVISSFESRLCCNVNPIATVHHKVVCQRCFESLREKYSGGAWMLSSSGH